MSLIDQAIIGLNVAGQRLCLHRVVFNDCFIPIFDTRLHNDGDIALPSGVQPAIYEWPPGDLDGLCNIFLSRYCQRMLLPLNAAWRGHFSANHITWWNMFSIKLTIGRFGDTRQISRSLGGYFFRQRDILRIIAQMHGGVEMQLRKACLYIITDQPASFVHSLSRRLGLPDAGSEMIASQQH